METAHVTISSNQFNNISFAPIRWKEVVDWLDYVYKQEPTDNYRHGIYLELYNSYVTAQIEEESNVKHHLISVLLSDFYDEMLYKFPPPVDLLFFDSFLLFGYKYGYKCIGRSFSLLQQYAVRFRQPITDCISKFDFFSEMDLRKQSTELSHIVWNLDVNALLLFSNMLINEMYSTGSFLLKRGMRTLRDFTDVIGFRVSSLLKFLVEKYDGGISTYCLKGRQLVEQNFIINQKVVEFIIGSQTGSNNVFSLS